MQPILYTLFTLSCWISGIAAATTPGKAPAVFGVVPAEEPDTRGLAVAAVAPGSPAAKSGIQAGDILLQIDGKPTRHRSDLLSAILARTPGDTIPVSYIRENRTIATHVTLATRRPRKTQPTDSTDPGYKEHGDRLVKKLNISPALLKQMRTLKYDIRCALATLPEPFAPTDVSDKLQQLRDLARDAQAHRHGWMVGRACEAYLQFHDAEGTIVLHGANNQLTLEIYTPHGQLLQKVPLNTKQQRLAIPPALLERLQRLR